MQKVHVPKPTLEERQVTLDRVNAELAKHKLPPWKNAKRLGDFTRNEFQIVDVVSSKQILDDKRIEITFRVLVPLYVRKRTGQIEGYYRMEFSAPIGAAVILWRGKVLLNLQHRPVCGDWRLEIPRCWIEREESATLERKARYVLAKEFGPDWEKTATITSCVLVEEVWENTGERATPFEVFLVKLSDDTPEPTEMFLGQIPKLVTWGEFCKMKFRDLHSRGVRESVLEVLNVLGGAAQGGPDLIR